MSVQLMWQKPERVREVALESVSFVHPSCHVAYVDEYMQLRLRHWGSDEQAQADGGVVKYKRQVLASASSAARCGH